MNSMFYMGGVSSLKQRILQTSFDEFYLESGISNGIGEHFGQKLPHTPIDCVVVLHDERNTSAARGVIFWAWQLSGILSARSDGRTKMLNYDYNGATFPGWRTPVLERRDYRTEEEKCRNPTTIQELSVMLPTPESNVIAIN